MSSAKYEINKYSDNVGKAVENRDQNYFPVSYERKTSLEIINEAKASIKAVKTKRPFTPLESSRRLFGHNERTAWLSSSLSSDQYLGEKRPLTAIRLTPLKTRSHLDLNICDLSLSSAPKATNTMGALNSVQEDVEVKDHVDYSSPTKQKSVMLKSEKETSSIKKSYRRESDPVLMVESGKKKNRDSLSTRHQSEKLKSDLYTAHIKPLISKLANYSELSGEDLILVMNDLYTALETNNLFKKKFKERSTILRTVFNLIDQHDTRLLIYVSRIILAMNVTKNNLLSLCKLIYKVSRNEANDHLFAETNFLEIYIRTLASMKLREHRDALVYSTATIKFLAANEELYQPMLRSNIIGVLTEKMTAVNDEVLGSTVPVELCSHILVQLTAAIRNLLENEGFLPHLVDYGSLKEISRTIEININDEDIVKNISRIMSKVTVVEKCCDEIMNYKSISDILLLCLKKYKQKQDIIVRVCFVLGNLTAHSDDARLEISSNAKWLEILMKILDNYLKLDLHEKSRKTEDKSVSDTEDIVVKVIRVIANMSIHPEIGPSLAQNEDIVAKLLQILDKINVANSEELVVCTLSTLNNLSYYCVDNSALYDKQEKITCGLIKILNIGHEKCITEAVSVLGNLSRVKYIRDLLMNEEGGKMIVTQLDSDNTQIIYSSCGVLMNLLLDQEKKTLLLNNGGFDKLISVLQDYGRIDWILCSLVCQTIWNFVSEFNDLILSVGESKLEDLVFILEDYLDPENVLSFSSEISPQEHTKKVLQSQWDTDFHPIASDLLDKLIKELNVC